LIKFMFLKEYLDTYIFIGYNILNVFASRERGVGQ